MILSTIKELKENNICFKQKMMMKMKMKKFVMTNSLQIIKKIILNEIIFQIEKKIYFQNSSFILRNFIFFLNIKIFFIDTHIVIIIFQFISFLKKIFINFIF